MSNSGRPNIAIIGAVAFLHASKLPGSYNFELCLRSSDIQANSAKLAETPDLSNVPSEYHKFADIFSKTKAETLPPYCSYDLKINLKKGAQPLVGPIYSLDDILIYLNNMSKHHWYVKEVLKHLYKTGLYAKAEKCKFHSESVEYLGYILFPSSLTISNDKVKIIQDWLEPKKVKDIQSFLGFTKFYRQFIFNYLNIVISLICLTQKDIPWKFDSFCQDAFNSLKKVFTSTPILTHWIPDAQLIVETDASDYALTAILSIVNEDNEVHPVAFHSHTFTVAELNYDTHDKELLAIFEAFKIWQHYLEGPAYPIDVVMDHKNLEYFSTTKVLTRR